MFETKDSGKRAEFDSGMVRDTSEGKARFDLCLAKGVPYKEQMLTRFAELMQRGSIKYSARNWEQAESQEELDRFKESALRHMMQWFCGEVDEDHAAAVLFNITAYEATITKLAPVKTSILDTMVAEARELKDMIGHKLIQK
jgi:hypothetical protein